VWNCQSFRPRHPSFPGVVQDISCKQLSNGEKILIAVPYIKPELYYDSLLKYLGHDACQGGSLSFACYAVDTCEDNPETTEWVMEVLDGGTVPLMIGLG
jgi:hypothetical protein